MRVLFVCGREPEYTRNQMVLKALRQQAEVIEITDSSRNYVVRHLHLIWKFIARFRRHDVIVVGFYGYLLVFLARLFSRRPLIFDALPLDLSHPLLRSTLVRAHFVGWPAGVLDGQARLPAC